MSITINVYVARARNFSFSWSSYLKTLKHIENQTKFYNGRQERKKKNIKENVHI